MKDGFSQHSCQIKAPFQSVNTQNCSQFAECAGMSSWHQSESQVWFQDRVLWLIPHNSHCKAFWETNHTKGMSSVKLHRSALAHTHTRSQGNKEASSHRCPGINRPLSKHPKKKRGRERERERMGERDRPKVGKLLMVKNAIISWGGCYPSLTSSPSFEKVLCCTFRIYLMTKHTRPGQDRLG